MAHRTLINGTAYDISGGKAMVSGTGYDIASGKTLVGGTGYEIPFGGKLIPVNVKGGTAYEATRGFCQYNGETYTNGTIYVSPGEKVRVYLRTSLRYETDSLDFYVNGAYVSGTIVDNTSKEYYHTVTGPTTIAFRFVTYTATATITYT